MIRTLALVGAKFRPPAAGLLAVLPAHAALALRREPSNLYDPNAIQVLVTRETLALVNVDRLAEACSGYGITLEDLASTPEWHLGYVPRSEAEHLAPLMDRASASELRGELTFSASGSAQVRADFPGN